MQTKNVIDIRDLHVLYKQRWRKDVVALQGLNLSVHRGEVFGFLGPNGAGKSTTIKTLLGFVRPQQGDATVFGKPLGSLESRKRIGYLPEVALYYPYLKANEILTMYAQLQGFSNTQIRVQVPRLLERVGLQGKQDTLLKHYSKGMLQRIGLAQSLLGDPEVFILDEPASGLDPLGRRDLRQVILDLKERGKTIFFSSHELSEVELICHRIAIIKNGRLLWRGSVPDVVQSLDEYRIKFLPSGDAPQELAQRPVVACDDSPKTFEVVAQNKVERMKIIRHLVDTNADIVDLTSNRRSLENFFVEIITAPETDLKVLT